jgi:hypothetical protein
VCIVYYSRSGNTRFVAELLAEREGGELVPLEEKGSRRGLWGFLKSGYQASTKRSSRLKGDPWSRIAGCQRLYLLTPIWAGNGSPAANAFLDGAELRGKQVFIVTLQADPRHGKSAEVHGHLTERIRECGGEVSGAYALTSARPGRFAGKEHLRQEAGRIY